MGGKKTVKPYLFSAIIVSALANVQLQFRYSCHIQRLKKRGENVFVKSWSLDLGHGGRLVLCVFP